MVTQKPGKSGATKAPEFVQKGMKTPAPEPEILRVIGEEAERNGSSAMTSLQIDKVINACRFGKRRRQRSPQ